VEQPGTRGKLDWPLMLAILGLSALGLAMVNSATRETPGLEDALARQAIYLLVGLLLCTFLAWSDYRLLVGVSPIIYALGLAALLVVDIIGSTIHGGQRWLAIGGFTLQPSEFMKVALALLLAHYLNGRADESWRFSHLLGSGAIVLLPALLVYAQPDLGTAVMLFALWLFAVFVGGARVWHLLVLVAVALAGAPVIWNRLEPYMRERVLSFLWPGSNPEASYVVRQALISIGSGGLWGKGYLGGSQTQLHFLRVRHTDFIFSVIGEELGFAGCAVVVALFCFVTWRLLAIAQRASDAAGRVIAATAAVAIALQAFVNISMNLGWLPVTGLPLPFVSVGGSALIAQFLFVGLAQSVRLRS
jgi:rod shape determining protein RodA